MYSSCTAREPSWPGRSPGLSLPAQTLHPLGGLLWFSPPPMPISFTALSYLSKDPIWNSRIGDCFCSISIPFVSLCSAENNSGFHIWEQWYLPSALHAKGSYITSCCSTEQSHKDPSWISVPARFGADFPLAATPAWDILWHLSLVSRVFLCRKLDYPLSVTPTCASRVLHCLYFGLTTWNDKHSQLEC